MTLIETIVLVQAIGLFIVVGGLIAVLYHHRKPKDPEAPSNRGWWKLFRWGRCRSCDDILLITGRRTRNGYKYCPVCAHRLATVKIIPQSNKHGKAIEEAYKIECHVYELDGVPIFQWSAGKIQCGVFADLVRCLPDDVLYGYADIVLETIDDKELPVLRIVQTEQVEGLEPITYRMLNGQRPEVEETQDKEGAEES